MRFIQRTSVILAFALAAIAPNQLFAQYTLSLSSDSIKVEEMNEDILYEIRLDNIAGNDLELKWRITHNDFPNEDWEDFFCDYVCYPPEIRWHDLDLPGSASSFDMIHHIKMKTDEGIGESTICIFERSDSAGTVQCWTVKATTDPYLIYDTLTVEGQANLYVADGTVLQNGSAYAGAQQLIAGEWHLFQIDGVIYTYDHDHWMVLDVQEVNINGEDYIVINGSLFEWDGDQYVLYATMEEVMLDGSLVYVVEGDTFEVINGFYYPLSTTDIQTADIKLFPNPASITLQLTGAASGAQLSIYDLTGRLIQQKAVQGNTVDVSTLESGNYLLKVEVNGMQHLEKVMIVR